MQWLGFRFMKLMHRKVSMGTSSNTKALLQALLWRQQGDIGGRLGKLVIYIHNVMRPIQIFASHIVTLMWGFLEQKRFLEPKKTNSWSAKDYIIVLTLSALFTEYKYLEQSVLRRTRNLQVHSKSTILWHFWCFGNKNII